MRNISETGFSIKCMSCGNKINLVNKEDFLNMATSNQEMVRLIIDWGYEEGEFICKCGNQLGI